MAMSIWDTPNCKETHVHTYEIKMQRFQCQIWVTYTHSHAHTHIAATFSRCDTLGACETRMKRVGECVGLLGRTTVKFNLAQTNRRPTDTKAQPPSLPAGTSVPPSDQQTGHRTQSCWTRIERPHAVDVANAKLCVCVCACVPECCILCSAGEAALNTL